jgi:hypothetical protein
VPEEDIKTDDSQLLLDSVGVLTADEIDELLRGVPSPTAMALVKELIGNKLDPRRLKKLGVLLIGPLKKRNADRLAPVVEALSVSILETFHAQLGERFENPSVADLREVLDDVLAKHPAIGVRCTLAWVVAEEMVAADAARTVLLSDERLRLPDWPQATEEVAAATPADDEDGTSLADPDVEK